MGIGIARQIVDPDAMTDCRAGRSLVQPAEQRIFQSMEARHADCQDVAGAFGQRVLRNGPKLAKARQVLGTDAVSARSSGAVVREIDMRDFFPIEILLELDQSLAPIDVRIRKVAMALGR